MSWLDPNDVFSNKDLNKATAISIQAFNSINRNLFTIIKKLSESIIRLNIIDQITIHSHDTHFHFYPHNCPNHTRLYNVYLDKIDNDDIPIYYYPRRYGLCCCIKPAEVLYCESVMGSDLDGNGLIYNEDFIINPSDNSRPVEIAYLEENGTQNIKLPMLMWDEFLATLEYSV